MRVVCYQMGSPRRGFESLETRVQGNAFSIIIWSYMRAWIKFTGDLWRLAMVVGDCRCPAVIIVTLRKFATLHLFKRHPLGSH
jgi:hypothetical protein